MSTSCVAAPGTTLMLLLVAEVNEPLVAASVYAAPTLLSVRFEKLAIPLAALRVTVPPKVLPPGLLATR